MTSQLDSIIPAYQNAAGDPSIFEALAKKGYLTTGRLKIDIAYNGISPADGFSRVEGQAVSVEPPSEDIDALTAAHFPDGVVTKYTNAFKRFFEFKIVSVKTVLKPENLRTAFRRNMDVPLELSGCVFSRLGTTERPAFGIGSITLSDVNIKPTSIKHNSDLTEINGHIDWLRENNGLLRVIEGQQLVVKTHLPVSAMSVLNIINFGRLNISFTTGGNAIEGRDPRKPAEIREHPDWQKNLEDVLKRGPTS